MFSKHVVAMLGAWLRQAELVENWTQSETRLHLAERSFSCSLQEKQATKIKCFFKPKITNVRSAISHYFFKLSFFILPYLTYYCKPHSDFSHYAWLRRLLGGPRSLTIYHLVTAGSRSTIGLITAHIHCKNKKN